MRIDWNGSPPFGRRKSLVATLDRLRQKQGLASQVIVEIGTCEAFSPDGIGNAILAFAWYATQADSRIYSVDIREGAIKTAGTLVRQYVPRAIDRVDYFRGDAFEFAAQFAEPEIDLIYYDAPSEPQTWYLELHERLGDRLHSGALVLFDDTLPIRPWSGKGSVLIPHLLTRGWYLVPIDGEPVFPMALLEKV